MNYSNWQLLKDIAGFVRTYKKQFWLGTFFRVTSDLVWLFPVWAMSEIITFATHHQAGDSLQYFWGLMGAVLLAALYHFPTQDLAKYFIYQVAEKIGIDARLRTLRHLFKLDVLWHEKENSGNKIRRMHHGGDGLMTIVRLYVDLVIESTINLIAITVIFSQVKTVIALILVLFFMSYFLFSLKLTKKAADQSYRANVEWEKLEGMTFEAVNNISTIKSLNLGEKIMIYIDGTAKKLMEEIKKRIARFRFREGFLNTYQELFRQSIILITVWYVFKGELEVGVIAMALLYFSKIRESAGELAQVANEWVMAKIAIMRMKDILNEKPSVHESGHKLFNPNWKAIHIRNLHFSYGNKKVLNNFSLMINRGENIGVVGLSGTGKSTLFKLLLKSYDNYEGDILFDKTNLRDIKRDHFIKHVSVVPQETELFNLSLRENITLTPKLSGKAKRQFENALKIAHVNDFMDKLPKGAESAIGEKGIRLSGGEKQRVGIARAIYRQPQLLLMDEATSHLDIESEKKIQDALHQFFKKTTAIVIAHRLSTIREMSRIVMIKNGQVKEMGSFEELMRKKGEFYKLWKKQSL